MAHLSLTAGRPDPCGSKSATHDVVPETRGFDPLAERPWKGISFLVLERAGIVVERARALLPYCDPSGKVLYRRVKQADGREWFEPRPSEHGGLIPFGLETLPPVVDCDGLVGACLFVTEGESDCLALREAIAWWDVFPAGVYSIALPGAGSWRKEWRSYVDVFPTVFVIPDGDRAGDRMARDVRRDLRWCRLVILDPGQDVRQVLQAGRAEALLPCLDDADRRWRIEAALSLSGSGSLESFMQAFEEVS